MAREQRDRLRAEGLKKWRDGLYIPDQHEPGKQNLMSRKNLKAAQAAKAKKTGRK